jgi:hypothetical protein
VKNFITNKMTLMVGALLMSTTLLAAPASTRVGNGGVGVGINNKIYMLDLVEYGIQDQPYFGKKTPIGGIRETLTSIFADTNLTNIPLDNFEQKISDVMNVDYFMARTMLEAMKGLDWRLVDSSLIRLNDENTVLNPQNIEQVAIRVGLVVYIDKSLWSKLNDANKVVLLIHETLFAMANVDQYAKVKSQSAPDTRQHTGLFFTKAFVEKGYPAKYSNKSFIFFRGANASYEKTLFLKKSDQTFGDMELLALDDAAATATSVHPNVDGQGQPSFKWDDGTDRSMVRNNFCIRDDFKKVSFKFRLKYHTVVFGADKRTYQTSEGDQDRLSTADYSEPVRGSIITVTFKNTADCTARVQQIFEQEAAKAEKFFETRK